MLDAGIDVFSTVNVQHLESLNDRVAELTGVRVRETFPDQVLGSADEVVLVDLTPEALIAAPARGQGLPGRARAGRAQQLLPRREPGGAARGGAAPDRRGGRVEARGAGRRAARHARGAAGRRGAQAVAERVLALVTPRPRSQRLVRRAWRSAQRLGAELDLLYVFSRRARRRAARSARSSRRCAGWRRCWARLARRGGRRPGRHRRARGGRARHHLRADRPAAAAHRLRRLSRVAARPAAAQAARGRRAHRRRPLAPAGGGRVRACTPGAAAAGSAGASCSRSSARRCRRRRSRRPCGWRARRRRRSCPRTWWWSRSTWRWSRRRRCASARRRCPVMELIEQRATRARGAGRLAHRARALAPPRAAGARRARALRHARHAGADEHSDGFDAADVAWLLEHAPGEVLVLRPGADSESAG